MSTREELERIELTSHEQYIELLVKLRKLTRYISIVQIDGEEKDDPIVLKAKSVMQLHHSRTTDNWFSTYAPRRQAAEYVFVKHKGFFDYLMGFESFFFSHYNKNGAYEPEYTDFNTCDDIAFFDDEMQLLFYTCTHEGFAWIYPDVLKVDISYLKR